MARVKGPNDQDFRVWKSGKDGLWWIWEVVHPNYPAVRVSEFGYQSKRKALIDARGPRPTSRHPTEEEIADGVLRRKRTFLPLD